MNSNKLVKPKKCKIEINIDCKDEISDNKIGNNEIDGNEILKRKNPWKMFISKMIISFSSFVSLKAKLIFIKLR